MKVDRLGTVYENRVLELIECAEWNLPENNRIFYCPCVICMNITKISKKEVFHHLGCDVIIKILQYVCGMVM